MFSLTIKLKISLTPESRAGLMANVCLVLTPSSEAEADAEKPVCSPSL